MSTDASSDKEWIEASVSNISLAQSEKTLTVEEDILIADAKMRRDVVDKLIKFFVKVNSVVLFFIFVMYMSDIALVAFGLTPTKIINTEVMLAIIGATTVQLGALMVLMGKYLFPSPK